MLDIKKKFLISFGILLLLIGAVGGVMIQQVGKLGRAIDVILRENYQSVLLCQQMNNALERVDSALLYTFTNWDSDVAPVITENIELMKKSWAAELRNVTVQGEKERAEKIEKLLPRYIALLPEITDKKQPEQRRREIYRHQAYPLFLEIKALSGEILALNQQNMSQAKDSARIEAEYLHRRVLMILAGCCLFAIILTVLLKNWILNPIRKLIQLTTEISNGNLDIVLDSRSNDEIGQLSRSFNTMATALREARRNDRIKLERSERTTRDVFRELPTPIAVFDAVRGRVEIATQSADRCFKLHPGVKVDHLNLPWLDEIYEKVLHTGQVSTCSENDGIIQYFIDNKEYFFQPTAIPIPMDAPPEKISGIGVIMKDVTMAHEQQELKRSVISTVSHQLKTPLTSLQMSIYLLLEEKIGKLNPDQLDLVMAMRDDSDRLANIVSDLLDLNRASGRQKVKLVRHSPSALVAEAAERFNAECLEKNIRLVTEVAPDLPDIPVEKMRIRYIFDNLISNAIRFTPPGGTITLWAENRNDTVLFSVSDTGRGMSPEVRSHLFEQFYRAPGQDPKTGVGLGLSIVKEIITSMNGRISVESQEGAGSSFLFTLPSVAGEQTENGDEKPHVKWL